MSRLMFLSCEMDGWMNLRVCIITFYLGLCPPFTLVFRTLFFIENNMIIIHFLSVRPTYSTTLILLRWAQKTYLYGISASFYNQNEMVHCTSEGDVAYRENPMQTLFISCANPCYMMCVANYQRVKRALGAEFSRKRQHNTHQQHIY